MIVIDLSAEQALNAIKQINFTENLDRAGGAIMFSILEEAK